MNFTAFTLSGKDADKFLQGQITANTAKIGSEYLPTAICNLKGRVQFGLWIKKINDAFVIVLSSDLADDFQVHIKKYGTFSKISLSKPIQIYPCVMNHVPTFLENQSEADWQTWQEVSLKTGNYWITAKTSEQFQPQELRLHQRGGVDYDKGCYLGQEIIARLWFKATPKAWLHLVKAGDIDIDNKVTVVNSDGQLALVVARPDDLKNLTVLSLPDNLNGSVARG